MDWYGWEPGNAEQPTCGNTKIPVIRGDATNRK